MSPLWSRYGVRFVAVALLFTGVGGGVYLSDDREIQQQSATAQVETQTQVAEEHYLKEQHGTYLLGTARQREAENQAAKKAAEAAQAAAKRAQRAEEAVSRKKERAAAAKKAATATATAAPKAYTGPIPASCAEFSGHRKTGCAIMLDKGFDIDQFPCLNKLWNKESGWNPKAENPTSGAYGIPQALPGTKMASVASDWKTNPATQIKWGLGYIKGRYGTPCEAWSHSQSSGWY